jgi:hypothetical protein
VPGTGFDAFARLPAMRRAAVIGALAAVLVLAPGASAKFMLWLTVGDRSPKVMQPVAVVVHSEAQLSFDLRLIAVAPEKPWFRVVGTVTGDISRPHANIPHDGFEVTLHRLSNRAWRGVVRFPRRGRWQLVVPNGAPNGVIIPPPVRRAIVVS